MSISVRIPTQLRSLTGGAPQIEADGVDVGQVIAFISDRFPGVKERLLDDTGNVRRFVNVYVRDEDIRFLDGLQTEVRPGDEVAIIPAVAGGG